MTETATRSACRHAELTWMTALVHAFLICGAVVLCPGRCAAMSGNTEESGVIARLDVEKPSYYLGEPIMLVLSVHNSTLEPQVIGIDEVSTVGPAGPRFQARSADGLVVASPRVVSGTKWSPQLPVPPLETLRRRVLLNQYLEILEPGTYTVACSYDIDLKETRPDGTSFARTLTVRGDVPVTVLPHDREGVVAVAEALKAELEAPFDASALPPGEFREARRERSRRNRLLAQALGHLHPDVAPPYLIAASHHEDSYVRFEVARRMGFIAKQLAGSGDARAKALADSLCALLADREDGLVRKYAVQSLAETGDAGAFPAVARLADDTDDYVRVAVAKAMGELGPGNDEALSILHRMLRDEDWQVRRTAAASLGALGSPASIPLLLQLLGDPNDGVRAEAKASIEAIRADATPAKSSSAEEEGAPAKVHPGTNELGTPDAAPPRGVGVLAVALGVAGIVALSVAGIRLLRRRRKVS
jgi:hypothetical protein